MFAFFFCTEIQIGISPIVPETNDFMDGIKGCVYYYSSRSESYLTISGDKRSTIRCGNIKQNDMISIKSKGNKVTFYNNDKIMGILGIQSHLSYFVVVRCAHGTTLTIVS